MTLMFTLRSRLAVALLMMNMVMLPTSLAAGAGDTKADLVLVQDGQPRAQIVIAPDPPRAVPVAAAELQKFIEKLSGAKLPIVTTPDAATPLLIYVGESDHTRSLGISTEGLRHGAYRMVSGARWLALVGYDHDYVFKQPQPLTPADVPAAEAAWDQITGGIYRLPYGLSPMRHFNRELNLWYLDDMGSIHAVYGLLQDLGVRWYLPGDLGEIVPERKTIAITPIDRTVKPDYALRYPHSRAAFSNTTEALWAMRMGWNPAPDLVGPYSGAGVAHGMSHVVSRPEVRGKRREFYAMIGGERFIPDKNPSFCLSNEDLIAENVRFVRAVFDTYDPYMVSVHPSDGIVLVCQCERCAGQGTPERGRRGEASDYVWNYVNRVATEVYKTHPNKKIAGLAYANYQLPPLKIDQFSPNVIIGTPSGRTFFHNNEAEQKILAEARKQWLEKLPEGSKQTYHYEYFMDARPGRRTVNLPVVVTHTIAGHLREDRGISIGDHIDVERYRDSLQCLATMHLNLYVTSKFWWNAQTDLDALLDEYYTLYYGPAREPMRAALEYAEAHWPTMPQKPDHITGFLELLAKAQAAAPPDSVYAKRIALITDYTKPMTALRDQQQRGRDESIPPVELRGPKPPVTADQMKIDGKLDEPVWINVPGPSTPERLDLKAYALSDLVSGQRPRNATTFKVFFAQDALYMGIRCEDSDMKNVRIATTTHDDMAIWNGDLLELHLETQSHSYYAIVINPAGAVTDLDWENKARDTSWNSGAQVAVQRDDRGWTVELRIPVLDEVEGEIVELGRRGVVGRLPIRTYPWYMNLIRQRLREGDNEFSAYSPLGKKGFHDPSKFARLSKPK
jgi:hypothetical protein